MRAKSRTKKKTQKHSAKSKSPNETPKNVASQSLRSDDKLASILDLCNYQGYHRSQENDGNKDDTKVERERRTSPRVASMNSTNQEESGKHKRTKPVKKPVNKLLPSKGCSLDEEKKLTTKVVEKRMRGKIINYFHSSKSSVHSDQDLSLNETVGSVSTDISTEEEISQENESELRVHNLTKDIEQSSTEALSRSNKSTSCCTSDSMPVKPKPTSSSLPSDGVKSSCESYEYCSTVTNVKVDDDNHEFEYYDISSLCPPEKERQTEKIPLDHSRTIDCKSKINLSGINIDGSDKCDMLTQDEYSNTTESIGLQGRNRNSGDIDDVVSGADNRLDDGMPSVQSNKPFSNNNVLPKESSPIDDDISEGHHSEDKSSDSSPREGIDMTMSDFEDLMNASAISSFLDESDVSLGDTLSYAGTPPMEDDTVPYEEELMQKDTCLEDADEFIVANSEVIIGEDNLVTKSDINKDKCVSANMADVIDEGSTEKEVSNLLVQDYISNEGRVVSESDTNKDRYVSSNNSECTMDNIVDDNQAALNGDEVLDEEASNKNKLQLPLEIATSMKLGSLENNLIDDVKDEADGHSKLVVTIRKTVENDQDVKFIITPSKSIEEVAEMEELEHVNYADLSHLQQKKEDVEVGDHVMKKQVSDQIDNHDGDNALEKLQSCSVAKTDEKRSHTIQSSKLLSVEGKEEVKEEEVKMIQEKFAVGDLVIGKIVSFGWWFGKVVKQEKPPEKNCLWIYWYGDHKTLQLPTYSLLGYWAFHLTLNKSKLKQPIYKRAVTEFLEEASRKLLYTIGDDINEKKQNRFHTLLQWALNGFNGAVITLEDNVPRGHFTTTYTTSAILDNPDLKGMQIISNCSSHLSKSKMEDGNLENAETESNLLHETKQRDRSLQVDRYQQSTPTKRSLRSAINPLHFGKDVTGESLLNTDNNTNDFRGQEDIFKEDDVDFVKSAVDVKIDKRNVNRSLCGISGIKGEVKDALSSHQDTKGTRNQNRSPCKHGRSDSAKSVTGTSTLAGKNKLENPIKHVSSQRGDVNKDIIRNIEGNNGNKLSPNISEVARKKFVEPGNNKKIFMNSNYLSKKRFRVDDLVIGQIQGFGWWFGKVVKIGRISRKPAFCQICWYGDDTTTELSTEYLEDLSMFHKRYDKRRMKKNKYRNAVIEVLEEAAKRCAKTDLLIGTSPNSKHARIRSLIDWANCGFPETTVDPGDGIFRENIEKSHTVGGSDHEISDTSKEGQTRMTSTNLTSSVPPNVFQNGQMQDNLISSAHVGDAKSSILDMSVNDLTSDHKQSIEVMAMQDLTNNNKQVTESIDSQYFTNSNMQLAEPINLQNASREVTEARNRKFTKIGGIYIDPSLIGTCPSVRRASIKATKAFSASGNKKKSEGNEEKREKLCDTKCNEKNEEYIKPSGTSGYEALSYKGNWCQPTKATSKNSKPFTALECDKSNYKLDPELNDSSSTENFSKREKDVKELQCNVLGEIGYEEPVSVEIAENKLTSSKLVTGNEQGIDFIEDTSNKSGEYQNIKGTHSTQLPMPIVHESSELVVSKFEVQQKLESSSSIFNKIPSEENAIFSLNNALPEKQSHVSSAILKGSYESSSHDVHGNINSDSVFQKTGISEHSRQPVDVNKKEILLKESLADLDNNFIMPSRVRRQTFLDATERFSKKPREPRIKQLNKTLTVKEVEIMSSNLAAGYTQDENCMSNEECNKGMSTIDTVVSNDHLPSDLNVANLELDEKLGNLTSDDKAVTKPTPNYFSNETMTEEQCHHGHNALSKDTTIDTSSAIDGIPTQVVITETVVDKTNISGVNEFDPLPMNVKKRRTGIELDLDLDVPTKVRRKSFLDATESFSKKEKNVKKLEDDKKEIGSSPDGTAKEPLIVDVNANLATGHEQIDQCMTTPQKRRGRKRKSEDTILPLSQLPLPVVDSDKIHREYKTGDLIIGKLQRFNWWFGKVISHKTAKQRPPLPGKCWVFWFGDHKVSEMELLSLESMDMFSHRLICNKIKGVYKKAVTEVLNEAATRCAKEGLPDVDCPEKRLNSLIDWAANGFQPMGTDTLYIHGISDSDTDGSCPETSSDTDTDNPTYHTPQKRTSKVNSSPILSEDIKKLFDSVARGKRDIEQLCLGCGDTKVEVAHPLFEGGLCKECKGSFMECTYLYDDDGHQMYCSICSEGNEILLCDQAGCCRSFCTVCIDMFCGIGYSDGISKKIGNWECFMCNSDRVHLLKSRDDWKERLTDLFQTTLEYKDFTPMVYYDHIPFEKRKPIRVLALFDGIATGFHVLKELDFEIEVYVASEIEEDAIKVAQVRHGKVIKHVGDVRNIYKKHLDEWGPFDLLIGGSPCNDLSIANPLRKGIYEGTGRLFFEYYRIKELLIPNPVESRPFFWLFENVVGMRQADREAITRFLQCPPVLVNSKAVSAQNRSRYFWGNLPGMNRQLYPATSDKLNLQDCLEPNCGRVARLDKVRCITTMTNSLRQTKKALLPIELKTSPTSPKTEDGLWLTEIERIFGFPEHYTDVGNMGQRQRQKLLGKSWSVPVMRHLFTPLRNYFKTKTMNDNDFAKSVETQTYTDDN